MNDSEIAFRWPWFFATIIGALIGFVAGEIIEAIVTHLRENTAKKRERLPLKMREDKLV